MKSKPKKRDPYAMPAKQRSGAGGHGDKKKEDDKKKCREKITKEKGKKMNQKTKDGYVFYNFTEEELCDIIRKHLININGLEFPYNTDEKPKILSVGDWGGSEGVFKLKVKL